MTYTPDASMRYDLHAAIRKLIGNGGSSSSSTDVTLVVNVLQAFFPDKTHSELSQAVANVLSQEGRATTADAQDREPHSRKR